MSHVGFAGSAIGIGAINSGNSSDSISTFSLSAYDMTLMSSYTGFDFTDTWTMDGNASYQYPELKSVAMVYEAATGITITAPSDTVALFDTLLLTASPVPDTASLPPILWSIQAGDATVSNTGLVTASQIGYVTMRATSAIDDTVYGEYTINVTNSLSGSGTEADPYLITSVYDLDRIRGSVSADYYYKLTADIEFNAEDFDEGGDFYNGGEGWIPIGYSVSGPFVCVFNGHFDGDGHSITGLYINRPDAGSQGLFSSIDTQPGYGVKDLNLVNANITGQSQVGGIAGQANSTSFEGCTTSGSITGERCVGSIAGSAYGTSFEDCNNSGSITGTSYVGGIAGNAIDTNFGDCTNSGSITGESSVGGIAGSATNTSFEGCTNSGSITGSITDSYSIGGIVGRLDAYVRSGISFSIGYCLYTCLNTGSISGRSNVGGIVGYSSNTTGGITAISGCGNSGNIIGDTYRNYVGGIAGHIEAGAATSACWNSGAVSGNSCVGGIVGYNRDSNISDCFNAGSVCEHTGGGIVGLNQADNKTSYIRRCYNAGDAVYAIADQLSSYPISYGPVIQNCYMLGRDAAYGYSIHDSRLNPGSVTALTEQQLRDQTSFSNFDFTGTWIMSTDAGYPYPVLRNSVDFIPLAVTGITIDTGSLPETIIADASYQLTYTVAPSNASLRTVAWSVVSGAATIDDDGIFTATAGGEIVVRATAQDGSEVYGEATLSVYKWAQGNGTMESPFIITSTDELDLMRYALNSHYCLGNDIAFTAADFAAGGTFYNDGRGWAPIGVYNDIFGGTLDGDGYSISGMRISITDESDLMDANEIGLFGIVSGASIKDLSMTDARITVAFSSDHRYQVTVGGIAGWCDGSISDCSFNGTIDCRVKVGDLHSGDGLTIGGIVASVDDRMVGTQISGCSFSGAIDIDITCSDDDSPVSNYLMQTSYRIGGIAGGSYDGSISDCTSAGSISFTLSEVENTSHNSLAFHEVITGGIVGYVELTDIQGCTNYAAVTNTTDGGMVGINSCFSFIAGGILGASSHWGGSSGGELRGFSKETLTNCTNNGNVTSIMAGDSLDDFTANVYAGGIAGGVGAVNGSTNNGNVTAQVTTTSGSASGTDYCTVRVCSGGIAASCISATGCTNYGDVTKRTQAGFGLNGAGGIVGYAISSAEACINYGDVSELGDGSGKNVLSGCGGIAGVCKQNVTVAESINTGSIYSSGYGAGAGGIIGASWYSDVSDCYNSGRITANGVLSCAGGIAGLNAKCSFCFSTGTVKGLSPTSYAGGVTGKDCTVDACAYLDTSAERGMGKGFDDAVKLTRSEFLSAQMFTDFGSDIWTFTKPNVTYAYPQLTRLLNKKIYVTSISMTVPDGKVMVGGTVQTLFDINPDSADDTSLFLTVGDDLLASIDDDGLISGLGLGITTVNAYAMDGSGVRGVTVLTVLDENSPIVPVALTISKTSASPSGTASIGVDMGAGANAHAMQFAIEYDKSRLTLASAAVMSPFDALGIDINTATPGVIFVAWEGNEPLIDGGRLLDLKFNVSSSAAEGDAYVRFSQTETFKLSHVEGQTYTDVFCQKTDGMVIVSSVMYGDVDQNGTVNVIDANMVRRHCAELITLEGAGLLAVDVNCDGNVNIVDANLIRRYCVRLVEVLPVK